MNNPYSFIKNHRGINITGIYPFRDKEVIGVFYCSCTMYKNTCYVRKRGKRLAYSGDTEYYPDDSDIYFYSLEEAISGIDQYLLCELIRKLLCL